MCISGLSMLMLRIIYGKQWKDKLDTMKQWIPPVVGFATFFWIIAWIFLFSGATELFPFLIAYPVIIAVWTIYVRAKH